MAWILTGSGGATWQGADWVVRNALEFLVPALRKSGATLLAERCEEALASGARALDLSEELDRERWSAAWRRALDAACASIEAEGPRGWNQPERFGPFLGSVRSLAGLTRHDGNALVVSLAELIRDPP
jgi:hypothetical protein